MGIFRESAKGYQESPERQIYGIKSNRLIVPLDICILEQGSASSTFILPNTPIFKNAADLMLTGGAKIGTIEDYDIPSVLNGVNPVVKVKPANGVSFSTELLSSLTDLVAPGGVSVSDQVVLEIDGVQSKGEVVRDLSKFTYELLDFEIDAYQVKFNKRLLDFCHGARVFYPSSKKVLGMLISTEEQADGSCLALVYPAHLV